MNRSMLRRLVWGVLIVFIGASMLFGYVGNGFDLSDLIGTFWPLFLVAIGLDGMLSRKKNDHWWGGFMAGLGVYFLARNLGFYYISIGSMISYAIPVIIILYGLKMIFKPKRSEKPQQMEDWQSYPGDAPMPPPPPLHPDPTKMYQNGQPGRAGQQDQATQSGQSGQSGQTSRQGYSQSAYQESEYRSDNDYDYEGNMDYKSYKEQYKYYKNEYKAYKKHYKSSKHNREEWWDSNPNVQNRSGFIGDIYIGSDYWELRPMNVSHFIGDTVIDLTKAQIPYGETKLNISSFIGDVKIYLPNDYEVGIQVVTHSFIGDTKVMDRKDSGMFRNSSLSTPAYNECEKQIKLVVSSFIGDVTATRVG